MAQTQQLRDIDCVANFKRQMTQELIKQTDIFIILGASVSKVLNVILK